MPSVISLTRLARRRAVGEPHLVADQVAELGAELLGDPLGDRPRGDPARLGVADQPPSRAAAELEADLRQLGGLARAGLAATITTWWSRIAAAMSSRALADRQLRAGR